MQATSLPMESMGHKSKKEANFVKKYEVMFIVNAANDEVIKAAVKLVLSPESVVPLTKLMNGANVILPTKSDTRAKATT